MSRNKELLGWHFAEASGRLGYGDGREIKVGETLTVEPPIELCEHGLHASVRVIDALSYARGPLACRVRLSGEIKAPKGEDKAVATERTVIGMVDATPVLRDFVRFTLVYRQPFVAEIFAQLNLPQHADAIRNLDMNAASFEDIKMVFDAAREDADAGAAAGGAAREAAWAARAARAAGAAAWAAEAAAWGAAREAAWAARAAGAAAWEAARAAARGAAGAAAWAAAWAAAEAAGAAAEAARGAAWEAAVEAAEAALNGELERLLTTAIEETTEVAS